MKYFFILFQLIFIILLTNCGVDHNNSYQESLQGIWTNEGTTFIFKDSLVKSKINTPFRNYILSSDTLRIQNFRKDGYKDYRVIRLTEKTMWLLTNSSDTIALKKYEEYTSGNIKLEKLIIMFDPGTVQLPIGIEYIVEINSNKLCYYEGEISNRVLASRVGIPEETGYYEGIICDKEFDYLLNLVMNVPLASLKKYYNPRLDHHNVINIIFYLKINGGKNVKKIQTTINGFENIPFELGILTSYLLEANRYVNLSKTNIKHKFEF